MKGPWDSIEEMNKIDNVVNMHVNCAGLFMSFVYIWKLLVPLCKYVGVVLDESNPSIETSKKMEIETSKEIETSEEIEIEISSSKNLHYYFKEPLYWDEVQQMFVTGN